MMAISSEKPRIQFINHACVVVSYGEIKLLCDPWISGDAFHKGWNLIVENSVAAMTDILKEVTHIWVSHEHPDHFSVPFFNQFADIIRLQSITILFQNIKDKRVIEFFSAKKLPYQELPLSETFPLSHDFSVMCIKDGFYDSALVIKAGNSTLLNLNDCVVNTLARAEEIFKLTGKVDILLTQFSYAAWKGGRLHQQWRMLAAQEKLEAIKLQVAQFTPQYLIPFASFSYFSNTENHYLNDSVNKPEAVITALKNTSVNVLVMKPYDCFDGNYVLPRTKQAVDFWSAQYAEVAQRPCQEYEVVEVDILAKSFDEYVSRIIKNNSLFFMKFCRVISPIAIFQPVIIQLNDLHINVQFDYLNRKFAVATDVVTQKPQLSMRSESLFFIFKYSFGFNTLTVNGCFEEAKEGGFVEATKTLAIENINNLGVFFRPSILFNPAVIALCISRLWRVSKKLMAKK